MKNVTTYLGILFAALLLTACTTQVTQSTSTPPVDERVADGRVVMTVTDAAANMGAVTSIKMTVEKVSLHSEADGWVVVASPQRTYDLLALKASGENALLVDISLAPGRYDQIRLDISSLKVTDANSTHDAKIPSETLRLNGEVVVLENKTATVSFDFIADESLHMTGNGLYIFAPVIQLESRTDANVDITGSNVRVSGGTVQTSSRVGMDVAGNLVVGGKLPPFLTIGTDGKITGTQDRLNANGTAVGGVVVDPNSRIP